MTCSWNNIMRQPTPYPAWWHRKTYPCEAGLGGTIIQDILKAFTWRFVHDYLKLRNFHYPVTNLATVDVYGCDYITTNGVLYLYIIGGFTPCGAYIISAWALTLSVQQDKAMRRPQFVGQTTGGSHAFLCSYDTLMSNRTVKKGTNLRT